VLVDDKLQILELRGDTQAYLDAAPGNAPQDLMEVARPGLVAPLRAAIAEARRTMTPARREHVVVDQGGLGKSCDIVVLPCAGAFGVVFEDRDDDVREARRARGEAERANHAKDQFLAVLAHELRSPLSSMLVQAQLLRERHMDPALIRRASEAIERGTKVQVQLIDDLLDVARIMNGKLRMQSHIVDLCAVIRAAIDGVSAQAARKSIAVSVVLDEAIGRVRGDPTRLQQVVSNLLTNAIKFTPEHGQVGVALALVDGQARLTVSDTGIGIEPAFLPHVFTRFAQEDSSTTRTHGGLGLGLAIVRYISEAHGGVVRAESRGKGAGATFTVELPLMSVRQSGVTRTAPPLTSGDAETADRGLLRDLRVLIIDDDTAMGDAVADMLQRRGARVALAGSAVEASAVVEQFHPDVLVCDIAMPGEDGYSFIRRLRSLDPATGGGIPALALTALATDTDRRQALSAGFQMHLTKPIDIGHLTAAIAALVSNVRA